MKHVAFSVACFFFVATKTFWVEKGKERLWAVSNEPASLPLRRLRDHKTTSQRVAAADASLSLRSRKGIESIESSLSLNH